MRTVLTMNPTFIRLRSITGKTVGTLLRSAIAFALLLFFVVTVDGQAIGPQASRLIGTIQSNNFIGAVFSDSKGEQTFYRVFDTLPDGSRIVAVRSDSISLKGTDGMSYDMYIAHDMTKSPVANTGAPIQPVVPAEPFAAGALQNRSTEQPDAQARPRGRHGRMQSDEE
jgi:hypothetical protein